ncbi:MAG: RES family NAD+ phosphorylase [Achromobacter piechaudii]
MTALWRLSNARDLMPRARPAGRWHGAGAPVIVLEASAAAAVLARLVLAEVAHPRSLPRHYQLLAVTAPAGSVDQAAAPLRWQTDLRATQVVGDAWLDEGSSLLLRVPASGGGFQYLLNTAHPDMARCRVASSAVYPYAPHLGAMAAAVRENADWLAPASEAAQRD